MCMVSMVYSPQSQLQPNQDGALIAELSVRLRRRPDASSLQFILNVAQLLGQSCHNAPLLLPLLPIILHGMARHLESDGVQVGHHGTNARCMHQYTAARTVHAPYVLCCVCRSAASASSPTSPCRGAAAVRSLRTAACSTPS